MGEVTIGVPSIHLSLNVLGQMPFLLPLVSSMYFIGLKYIRDARLFTSPALFIGKNPPCFTHPAYCCICCDEAEAPAPQRRKGLP